MLSSPNELTLQEFLALPTEEVHKLISPHKLSISLLLNGTRRLYIANHFDTPPTDYSYMADCLDDILTNIGRILVLLAELGIHRVFLPSYSEDQEERHPVARKFLLKGLEGLVEHPAVLEAYHKMNYSVRFYGDMAYLPPEITEKMREFSKTHAAENDYYVYYGIDGGNPYTYLLQLSHEFSMKHKRAPQWEDMLGLYYGDKTLEPLNILVAFSRIYARLGIPPLLEGNDRIYATAVSPLAITDTAVRSIIYDYVFNTQDRGRDYINFDPDELRRLKAFYAANQDTVIGLTRKFRGGICYPQPTINWPEELAAVDG